MAKKMIPIGKRGVVYMPKEILKEFHLNEGDYLEAYGTPEGIVLKPKVFMDKDQAWFWTEEWQKGEKEADEDIRHGKTASHGTAGDFIKAMEKRRKANKK